MKRALNFSSRNLRELCRDPLSYIFIIGFPVIMLLLMTVINSAIPPEANMTLFRIDRLAPAVCVFGLSFVMLFAALSVSKDRSSALLTRLRCSPMRPADFIFGYILPLLLVSVAQMTVTLVSAAVIALALGDSLPLGGTLLTIPTLLPSALLFISLGIIFGSLLGEKSAPPCASVIISASSILGGIWFDLSTLPEDGVFGYICRILPFSHSTDAAVAAVGGEFSALFSSAAITLAWSAAITLLAIIIFKFKLKSEKN